MSRILVLVLLTFSLSACGDPSDGTDGTSGVNGNDGTNGLTGSAGSQGTSCTVSSVLPGLEAPDGGALITCGTEAVLVLNGVPGLVSPYQLSEIIDPCGDAAGIYDEVILKMASGKLLASFSDNANGANTRLSELPAGSYATTDGSSCFFQVTSDGSVTW